MVRKESMVTRKGPEGQTTNQTDVNSSSSKSRKLENHHDGSMSLNRRIVTTIPAGTGDAIHHKTYDYPSLGSRQNMATVNNNNISSGSNQQSVQAKAGNRISQQRAYSMGESLNRNLDTDMYGNDYYGSHVGSQNNLLRNRQPSASSLTNSGTGQFITDEINSLRNFQKDQRKKDESIADLEEIRYQKIMALCDEITHGNFDGKIDSGTSSMQTTPHHNGNHTLPRNRRGSAQNVNQVNSQNTNSSQNTTSIHQNQLHHSLHSNQQQSTQQQSTHPNNHQNISTNFPPFNPEHSLQIELHQLKNKISHIESQLDEAQRNAEIEKKLIQAELKNENQVLAEDEKKLREVNHELNCLKQDFQEKLDNIDNTQEEFLILEQTSIIEDEHETEEARVGKMQVRLEKEIESRKVRLQSLKRQLGTIKDQELVDTQRLTRHRDQCIQQLQKAESLRDLQNRQKKANSVHNGSVGHQSIGNQSQPMTGYQMGGFKPPRAATEHNFGFNNTGSRSVVSARPSRSRQRNGPIKSTGGITGGVHRRFGSTDSRLKSAQSSKTINDLYHTGPPRMYDSMSRASIADSCDVIGYNKVIGGSRNGLQSPNNGQQNIEQQRRLDEMKNLLVEIKKEQQKLDMAKSRIELNKMDTSSQKSGGSRVKRQVVSHSSPKTTKIQGQRLSSGSTSGHVHNGTSISPQTNFDVSSVVSGSNIVQPEDSVSQGNIKLRTRSQSLPRQRPMTRYLPIRESEITQEFNLKIHIETCGHFVTKCKEIQLSGNSICGYLAKKSSHSLGRWNKRWFSFDRTSKTLTYYASRRSTKARGIIFFQQIEDVYPDHTSGKRFMTRKSGVNGQVGFCVKCAHKTYYLSAETPEAMRIWVDAIMTGAEGSQAFRS